jgi:hypothetical protein
VLNVKNHQIALLSIQYPDLREKKEPERRSKRLAKDSLIIGDSITVFVHCDKVKENVFINDKFPSISSSAFTCLDVLQLKFEQDYNVTKVQNPTFYDLNTDNIYDLNIEVRDLNGDLVELPADGYIVMKIAIKPI